MAATTPCYEWDDDERSMRRAWPCPKESRQNTHDHGESVPSVTQVMKEYYDEEKQALYTHYQNDYKRTQSWGNDTGARDTGESESAWEWDGQSVWASTEGDLEDVSPDTSEDPDATTEGIIDNSDLIDREVYKKFSYV